MMRMRQLLKISIVMLIVVSLGGLALAQRGRGGRGGGGRGGGGFGGGGFRGGAGGAVYDEHGGLFVPGGEPDSHLPADRNGLADWPVDPHFKRDPFTFVRIRYTSAGRGASWITDYPDSDLNFSFRLQQMTSLKVSNKPIVLDLDDPRILDYPLIYMLEVGSLQFTDDEMENLRHFCMNGGFLLVDDHWGVEQYENFHQEILRVFPGREPQELPIEHPIFHNVFNLKEKPQIPGIRAARQAYAMGRQDIVWEGDAIGAHYRAIYDDKGRIMVLICSNTDLGDGWEREGEEEWYFHRFSEKLAYPMGINIVVYAMTH